MIGYFGRPFNFKHKSLSTKTHIFINGKVLCGYKPHKTLKFQWCAIDIKNNLYYVECGKCKEKYLKIRRKKLK